MKRKNNFKTLMIFSVAVIMLVSSIPMMTLAEDTDTIHVSHGEATWESKGSKSETWYACNAYDSSMDEGPISFPSDDPSDVTLITASDIFLTGGCFVEDTWYACEYYDGSSYPDDTIWTIDTTDGSMTEIGDYGLTEALNGLAYDDSTETLYGCTGTNLYTVDTVTGSATLVGSMGTSGLFVGIASDGQGTLYGVDIGDESLYSINPTTAVATLIGDTGIGNLNYAQDMAFDKNNDVLYIAAYTETNNGELYSCDVTDASSTLIGAFGVLEVTAFAIPYDFYTPEHDISVTDLDVPGTVAHGDTQTVSAMVNNIGNNTETSVVVDFKVDSSVIDSTTITSIDPEESVPVSFLWDPAIGTYFVEIESQPITDEYDLANNAVNKTVDVIAAPAIDVDPMSLTFMLPPDATDSKTVTITNLPTAEAILNYDITVDDGGSGVLSVSPDTGSIDIDDYDDITVSVDSTGLTQGVYPGSIIIESNDLDDPEVIVTGELIVVYEDDMAAVSINSPTGTIYDVSHVVNATVQNMGSNPQTDVTVNCSIFEGGVGGDVINEDFSTDPVDWTITDVGGTAWEWDDVDERMENTYGSSTPNEGYLDSPVLDCSGKSGITLEFWHYWKADYSNGDQDGYVRGSIDGGTTWPYLIDEFHHNDPAEEDAVKSYDISSWADDQAQVMIRFDVYNDNDWYWRIDDFVVNAAITGDLIYSSETLVSLAAYEQQYVEFSPAWNADIGTYGIQVSTLLSGDENIVNDVASEVVTVEELPMPVINVDTGEGFFTIQDAIDDVDTLDGHTIQVASGLYPENLLVDKALTLTAASTPVIDGMGNVCINVQSSDVTINGFEIMNGSAGIQSYLGSPSTGDGYQNLHITNNHIHTIVNTAPPWGFGIYLGTEGERYNPGHGMYDPTLTSLMDFTGLLIDGNIIHDTTGASVTLQSLYATTGTLDFTNNEVYNGAQSALWIDGCWDIYVFENNLHDCGNGLFISSYSDGYYEGVPNQQWDSKNIDVIGNDLQSNSNAFVLWDGWPSLITVNQNNIVGNTAGITNNLAENISGTCNWWGDISGPTHAANPSGTGDSCSNYVVFSPWLLDTYPDGDCLGYPGPITNIDTGESFGTIQAAIDDVDTLDGHTILVNAITHTEGPQIVVNKDLTITGFGCENTIILANGNTGNSGDARAWWLVNDGVELHLSDMKIDGNGYDIYQAIRHKGLGTIDNVCFNDIKYPSYGGVAVAAFGGGPVDITNCMFTEIGRIGVLYWVTDSLFEGNTYVGKGDGDWLDYCLDIGGGGGVTVIGNTVSGCTGVASSDGSASAGFMVTTLYGAGSYATIEENDIFDCTMAIAVGYDETDTSAVTANYNNFIDCEWGIDTTGPIVDGTCNWWGDITGPYHDVDNAGGLGCNVSDNVTFLPWLTDTYPEGVCSGGLEQLDIEQTVQDRGFPIRHAVDGDWAGAQNFTPTLNHVSKVELYMRVFGTPEFDLTVELRLDDPQGTLLDTLVFTPGEVPTSWEWFEVDFEDSFVGIGSDVFVVIPPAPSGVTTSFGYEWGYAFGDVYPDGSFWFTRDGGGLWRDLPDIYEFAFKTYGY